MADLSSILGGLKARPIDIKAEADKWLNQGFDPANQYAQYGMAPPLRQGDMASIGLDMAPGIGDIKSGIEGLQAMTKGDSLGAVLGGLGALPMLPAMAGITRTKPPPVNTERAYKLFRLEPDRPGELFPLFVPMQAGAKTPTHRRDPMRHGASIPMGSWEDAEIGASAGTSKTGIAQVKSKLGPLSFRPGWHAGDYPIALHIGAGKAPRLDVETGKIKKMPTTRRPNEVWAEVDMANDVPWQEKAYERALRYKTSNPKTGAVRGEINPVTAAITDQIPEDGFYRYKTNPNMLGNWLIGGSMKVNRLLSDEEVRAINETLGVQDLPRQAPFDWQKYGFDPPY